MNGLEERLRGELHAESEQITPDSLATLRLPAPRPRGRSWRARSRAWPGRPRRRPGWAVPLAAAATVAAVITGTVALVRTAAVSPAGPAAASHAPAYYAYGVPEARPAGTGNTTTSTDAAVHSIAVRSVATGSLVTTVTVPHPLTSVVTLTAAANASVFVFSADRWQWQGGHRGRYHLDRRTPVAFFALRVTAGGHTRLTTLAQRVPVPLLRYTSIALSPDGRRLAMASVHGRTALVRVITLGSGVARQWTLPHASWRPRLEPAGAWTANGRTLVILTNSAQPPPQIPERTPVRLLDTAAPGTSLAASRLLNLPAGRDNRAGAGVFITPDGSALLEPVIRELSVPIPSFQPGNGFLGVYSARTGALLSGRGGWAWHRNADPLQAVLWSSPSGGRLLVLQPRPTGVTLGVLTPDSFRTTGAPLPRSRSAYQAMRTALLTSYLAPYPASTAG